MNGRPNEQADALSLGDELGSIELCHDALEHLQPTHISLMSRDWVQADLVGDGGQHTLVPVRAEIAEDGGQVVLLRPRQHAQTDVHHLQVYSKHETFMHAS